MTLSLLRLTTVLSLGLAAAMPPGARAFEPCASDGERAARREEDASEPRARRAAAAPLASRRPLHWIAGAHRFDDEPVAQLVPQNPAVPQRLETPAAVSVRVPADRARSYVLATLSGVHFWDQIPSSSPYQFGGSYRIYISSPLLPATCSVPNKVQFGVGLDAQFESDPSTTSISRQVDPTPTVPVDAALLAQLIEFHCGLPPEEAIPLGVELLRAETTWELSLRVRVVSVESVTLQNAFLDLFSD